MKNISVHLVENVTYQQEVKKNLQKTSNGDSILNNWLQSYAGPWFLLISTSRPEFYSWTGEWYPLIFSKTPFVSCFWLWEFTSSKFFRSAENWRFWRFLKKKIKFVCTKQLFEMWRYQFRTYKWKSEKVMASKQANWSPKHMIHVCVAWAIVWEGTLVQEMETNVMKQQASNVTETSNSFNVKYHLKVEWIFGTSIKILEVPST